MEVTNKYYVYAYLDPREKGEYNYGNYKFNYKPFYIGKGYGERLNKHLEFVKYKNKDVTNNNYKFNVIKQILNSKLEPIIIKIVEGVTNNVANDIEKLLIELMKFRYNNTGILTNISIGGLGGDTFTNNPNKELIREKHKLNAQGKNNHMYGLRLEQYPSHIAKINNRHWNTGRVASKETRAKMSYNNSTNNPNAKAVIKIDKFGNELECYNTAKEAAIENKANKSSICRAIRTGGCAGGYKWKFKNK